MLPAAGQALLEQYRQRDGVASSPAGLHKRWTAAKRELRGLLEQHPEIQAQAVAGRNAAYWHRKEPDAAVREQWGRAVERLEQVEQQIPRATLQEMSRPAVAAARPEGPTVALFGSMLAAAIKAGLEKPVQMWAVSRHLDESGAGRLPQEQLRAFLDWAPALFRKWIRRAVAAGILWREPNGRIAYISEKKLIPLLGMRAARGWAVAVSVDELKTADGPEIRALFYKAYHRGRGDDAGPITRGGWRNGRLHDTGIYKATGLSRPTQRKYEEMGGITAEAQYLDLGEYTAERLEAIRRGSSSDGPGQPAFVKREKHGARIVERLSNIYQSDLPTVKRGRRWLNLRIKAIAGRALNPLCKTTSGDCQEQQRRRYYSSRKQVVREAADGLARYLRIGRNIWRPIATGPPGASCYA